MSNRENEVESSTGDFIAPLNESPDDEQLLQKLQLLLVWLRTLEERSLELSELPDLSVVLVNEESSPPSSEESPADLADDEESEEDENNEIQRAISSLGWTLQNTIEAAVDARLKLLQVRQATGHHNRKIQGLLSAIRSRLFGISQQLGVSFLDVPQPDDIDSFEFARRVVGKWFIPHLREHVLSFDRVRCDLTVAMVEDDERQSFVDENGARTGSTDALPNGFHPAGTEPLAGWYGPLTGNMKQLSRWVVPHHKNKSNPHIPIQKKLIEKQDRYFGVKDDENSQLCHVFFSDEQEFDRANKRKELNPDAEPPSTNTNTNN